MTTAMPEIAPFPIEEFLTLNSREKAKICGLNVNGMNGKQLPCSIPVRVGLFFDGTNNNIERDRDGKRIGLPDATTGKSTTIEPYPLETNQCSHTNVARLFIAFPSHVKGGGNFSYYMPGVGTPFNEIGELAESDKGKAFGWGGQSRIIWALLQTLNSIYMTISGDLLLLSPDAAGKLAISYNDEVVSQNGEGAGSSYDYRHRDWFSQHLKKIKLALEAHPKPNIPSITLSVFGFSRGAAEAVAFCHFTSMLLDDRCIAGIPLKIDFLGVFDTVASVGISASAAKMLFVPGVIFDGYMSWAAHLLKPLPDCISSGLHCIAAHEQRMNFPVTQLFGNIIEQYFPGVHSDVGGGYAPGDQGRGRGAQSNPPKLRKLCAFK